MIDFHTHLLPCMDDGSKSVDESLAMLALMKEQGVDRVMATPHFYANRESAESFLERRERSYLQLKEKMHDAPLLSLGAEVKYYDGISRLPELQSLRIEGSRLLLLEMPFTRWTECSVREVLDIAAQGRVTPVLAHIERYLSKENQALLPRLLESGVLVQSNASFFAGYFSRFKAIKMVKNGQIHFIGSDSHNLTDRKPNTGRALDVLEKRMGKTFAEEFVAYGYDLLFENQLV